MRAKCISNLLIVKWAILFLPFDYSYKLTSDLLHLICVLCKNYNINDSEKWVQVVWLSYSKCAVTKNREKTPKLCSSDLCKMPLLSICYRDSWLFTCLLTHCCSLASLCGLPSFYLTEVHYCLSFLGSHCHITSSPLKSPNTTKNWSQQHECKCPSVKIFMEQAFCDICITSALQTLCQNCF